MEITGLEQGYLLGAERTREEMKESKGSDGWKGEALHHS
jgi:hypothetical protein